MRSLLPLGDQGALVYLENEAAAWCLATTIREMNASWLIDVVQAYASVAVFFDLGMTNFATVAEHLRGVASTPFQEEKEENRRLHCIPCCYEFGPDLDRVAEHARLTREDVIRLHAVTEYTVFAIGFSPGFPYLGYLPPELCDVPRLPAPRLRVEPGSVGLTERQTGIYPEAKPGGWNIIGRTPLQLVSVVDGYFPLHIGDRLRFLRITAKDFHRLQGQRLA